ncbi:MAG: YidC/Oxa1 family membrane protein insertase [Candidatus Woesebacteria bacterium]
MNQFQLFVQTILIHPIFEVLRFLTIQTGNFGVAIVLLTVLMRTILVPFTLPTLRSQKKMRDLKPKIDELKKKHKGDAKKIQQAQMELFKAHNINPLSGCLPYIVQFIVLIALYNVLRNFVANAAAIGMNVQSSFFMFDLSKPDHSLIIPIIAAVSQLVLSLMILPGAEKHDLIPNNSKKKSVQKANEKETDTQEMAETMQKQMVFMMPIMTGIISYQFPAGLGIYWITTTAYSIIQQWMVSGPGALTDYWKKIPFINRT